MRGQDGEIASTCGMKGGEFEVVWARISGRYAENAGSRGRKDETMRWSFSATIIRQFSPLLL